MMMVSEIGRGGDWTRAFEIAHMDKFEAPTVEGIEYPSMGVLQAWNDPESGTLYVGTYAATPDRQGQDTSWRVTNLPDSGEVFVICDGQPFDRFQAEGPATIRIDSDIGDHRYQIFTGYRGEGASTREARRTRSSIDKIGLASVTPQSMDTASRSTREGSTSFVPNGAAICGCC